MNNNSKIKLFLVDDDAVFLKLLEIKFLQLPDFSVETYRTGELCVANLSREPDIIILDYYFDVLDKNAMNGIETLDKIKAWKQSVPVIMLSSQDEIEVAVNCMHHKAFDYVVKSETAFMRLKHLISTIQRQQKLEKELCWYMDRM